MLGQMGSKEKMLEKILELFSQLPDAEDLKDGGADEIKETKPHLDGIEIATLPAHPAPDLKKGFK